MFKTLIVCGGRGCKDTETILGCIRGAEEWDCVICERQRQRIYQSCPWNHWGGKEKIKLDGNERITRMCYYCQRAEILSEITR